MKISALKYLMPCIHALRNITLVGNGPTKLQSISIFCYSTLSSQEKEKNKLSMGKKSSTLKIFSGN